MATLDEFLEGLFDILGPGGRLVALFLLFVIDAALFPALPELFFVLTYAFRPAGTDPTTWGLLLVALAVAGEAVGNSALYLFVKRALIETGHMPPRLEKLMRRWIGFLLVRDERVILLNRVAPVVPLVGAFIAACRWDFRKSLSYVVAGALAKYGILLVLVGLIGVAYDEATARWITVGFVILLVAASAVGSVLYRRREGPVPKGP